MLILAVYTYSMIPQWFALLKWEIIYKHVIFQQSRSLYAKIVTMTENLMFICSAKLDALNFEALILYFEVLILFSWLLTPTQWLRATRTVMNLNQPFNHDKKPLRIVNYATYDLNSVTISGTCTTGTRNAFKKADLTPADKTTNLDQNRDSNANLKLQSNKGLKNTQVQDKLYIFVILFQVLMNFQSWTFESGKCWKMCIWPVLAALPIWNP